MNIFSENYKIYVYSILVLKPLMGFFALVVSNWQCTHPLTQERQLCVLSLHRG
jgi:hypothetical protein